MGLNHQFILLPKLDYSDKWLDWSFMNQQPVERVDIHDDLIQYINDSLQWITTINPSIPELGYGLNIHGITLIDEHGAVLMGNIFDTWANLFSNGPEILVLTGNYQISNGNGMYQRIKINKDNLIQGFMKIREFTGKVINENCYILHYGI